MKAKKTKTEKIIEHFTKRPGANVKEVAAKYDAPVPMVYKLRKRAHATTEANMALAELQEQPKTRKITIGAAEAAVAKKLGIPLTDYVKQGLEAGTIKYDDERVPVLADDEEECEETVDDVLNARAQNYGKFIEGAEIMQMTKRLVHNYIEQRGTSLAFDQLEAIDMIIHKLGRIINGNPDHLDNWVDIAGYSTLVADRLKGNTR